MKRSEVTSPLSPLGAAQQPHQPNADLGEVKRSGDSADSLADPPGFRFVDHREL